MVWPIQGYEKYDGEIAKSSMTHNIHVSLVVYPRKENGDQVIETASRIGTAKAQEVDNIVHCSRKRNDHC